MTKLIRARLGCRHYLIRVWPQNQREIFFYGKEAFVLKKLEFCKLKQGFSCGSDRQTLNLNNT